ncbi:MAG: MFS transporter [Clostridiales Family XIII bacterium]|nr:MFS transporter [Clostridiales Family XIII bacterium]
MLATDLYLPAFPEITVYFGTSESTTNLTLILFVATLAISTLFWGPISDKYGRKPVAMAGGICFFVGSLCCIFAGSITQLILFRVLQAIGGGSTNMIATALIKDVYKEKQQEKILSIVQGIALIGPAVAPVIGAFVMRVTSWQGIFVIQAVMAAILVFGTIRLKETLQEPLDLSVFHALGRLLVVCRNRRFTLLVINFSLIPIAIMAFINASTYIFQNFFGLSGQTYSFFFSASALAMMAGTLLYLPISKLLGRTVSVYATFIEVAVAGLLILLIGDRSPYIFIILIAFTSFCACVIRPLGIFLSLNAQEKDTGSASSLINFTSLLASTIGMASLSFFSNYLHGVGILYLLIGIVAAAMFAICFKKV